MISIFDTHDHIGPWLIPDDARAELRVKQVGSTLYVQLWVALPEGQEVLLRMTEASAVIPLTLNIQTVLVETI